MIMIPLAQVTQINPRPPKGLDDSQETSFLAMASISEDGEIIHQETRSLKDVKKGFTYFQRGDVLLAKITPCFENGKSALTEKLEHPLGFGSTEFHVLRAIPEKLDPRFLFHLVRSSRLRFLGKKSMKGAAGHKRVPADFLENFTIPAWPLNDQIRIANLLGKVDGLITQRKKHLKQFDELLKSVFLKMFGDPVRNEKNWGKKPLEKLGTLNRGVSKHRPRNAPQLLGGKYPLIQTGEVSNSGTYITSYKQTYSDIGFSQSKIWPSGTLCITIAANIAQTGVLTFDSCFPDSIVAFSAFENEAHVLYVHGLFWFFQKILEKNAPAAAQKNINLEILRGLEVPKPPIELQAKFAVVVEKIERLKSRYQQSLSDLEALYSALSQKMLKGDLDLSGMPLPGMESEEENAELTNTVHFQTEENITLSLPDTDNLLDALENSGARNTLIAQWLEAYRSQLGTKPFSVQLFMSAAQTRLSDKLQALLENKTLEEDHKNRLIKLHPNNDIEFGAEEYEAIKCWVFKAIDSGTLTQAHDDAGNRVQLKAAQI
ncbi:MULTISPECIES: restriction endonuclease subunit S [Pseudomonas]|uniref:Type I restriction modification DNA specificity domain-containing protein n=2 Tax=Pseudomonas syringae group TaxID=136849 RepID=A0A3M4NXR7_PSEVI|nr:MULTISPECIES: restriction endonuclease subunit S [Pseudomonas]KTB69480.1 hypothetical protein AO068_22620 [Pseudomonas sp. ICMP 3272]POR59422.1 hypothetical protein BKM23_13260 [Pseudomonas syringae pv. syringae]RMO98844.1 hypothetical protein ALQ30_200748 [Pseudomonas syringae pv. persicae]RMQ11088.1 hypothetical protein ALQ09_200018 [Pseudomonas viridiflava]RMQ70688.1 hypothetical protein ALP98_200053 [Pseudomonas viridiflava]